MGWHPNESSFKPYFILCHSFNDWNETSKECFFHHSTLGSIFLCHFYGISLDVDGGMIWLILEWGKFLMEKILITPIPWPSLSFWVIVKCLFCHSMVIQILNDLRMKEMMLEWYFSHPGMMVNELNEGGMRTFLEQGKCPSLFPSIILSSFYPYFITLLPFKSL